MDFKIINSDCLDAMKELAPDSVDAIVTDPPYGLSFMGKEWDYGIPGKPFWTEALRVAKPGAHLLAFGGTRTYHRLACAIEDAGWEIRDCIMWVYGCLDEDTEVLVNGEFVQYNKAKKGSLALGYDIESGTFSWQRIEDTYLYDYDDTAYAIQSDCTDQLVSRNHRCIVERGGVEQFAFAEQVAQEREASVPVLEGLHGLLDRLPLPDERAGDEEQDLLKGVCCEGREFSSEEAQGSRAEQNLPRVRNEVLCASRMAEESKDKLLLGKLQKQGRVCSSSDKTQQGAPNSDNGGAETDFKSKDDRRSESSMERRGDIPTPQGELCECSVCALPEGISTNVSKGRVCDGTSSCCGESNRSAPEANGGCTSHQPHSAGQQTGEPDAVSDEQGSQVIRSAWRAKTTLARVTPVHYTGKMWCIKVATGAFVARRHGKIFITGNSGFPKSMDVSKAIAKRAGGDILAKDAIDFMHARREELGLSRNEFEKRIFGRADGNVRNWEDGISIPMPGLWTSIKKAMELDETPFDSVMERGDREVSRETGSFGYQKDGERWESEHVEREVVTDMAKEWSGWGTCLKPAWEPIIVARKPLDGTVAANVLKYGTGALNIDGCRVPTDGERVTVHDAPKGTFAGGEQGRGSSRNNNGNIVYKEVTGRFPANLIHDGSDEVTALFPESAGCGKARVVHRHAKSGDTGWGVDGKNYDMTVMDGGSGSAARFFKCCRDGEPSADRRYTDNGCTNFAMKPGMRRPAEDTPARFFYCAKASRQEKNLGCESLPEGNFHVTVKPVELMRYLVRLVCRKGGLVLDPFCGSGTTGIACKMEGMDFIGCELNPQYAEIAEKRISAWSAELENADDAPEQAEEPQPPTETVYNVDEL